MIIGSQVLEIAIGLIFVYLQLSLICSVLTEWLASVFSLRASNLEEGIRNMLEGLPAPVPVDGAAPNVKTLADAIFAHGLIKGLVKPGRFDRIRGKVAPSYLPANTFALALVDTLVPASAGTSQSVEEVRKAIKGLGEDCPARNALLALIDEKQSEIQKVRENIENWYNVAMERFAGWYKRKSQIIILVFGLLVAGAMNADTIVIVRALRDDPIVRGAAYTAAQESIKPSATATASPNPPATDSGNAGANSNSSADMSEAIAKVKKIQTDLDSLNLPLGWGYADPGNPNDDRRGPHGWEILLKIFGLLLTAIAVSLGAPFWFDLLSKISVIRSAIKPDEKATNPNTHST